jgi:hypothetical protein
MAGPCVWNEHGPVQLVFWGQAATTCPLITMIPDVTACVLSRWGHHPRSADLFGHGGRKFEVRTSELDRASLPASLRYSLLKTMQEALSRGPMLSLLSCPVASCPMHRREPVAALY